jgi:CTP synthase (UTP-ammonia lyase)
LQGVNEYWLRIGVIGDFNPSSPSHSATNNAIAHAQDALNLNASVYWVPTPSLAQKPAREVLSSFDALWCSPGSPYKDMRGAIEGIRFAREQGWPFFAT